MKKLILFAVVILGFTATSFAQLSATASVTADILPLVSIQKINDLSFGNIYTPSSAGTVTVAAQLVPNRAASSGLILGTGSGQAAMFTLVGLAGDYTVTMPANLTITLSDGANNMNAVLSAISPTPILGKITIDASGATTFYVGGTLHLGANQPYGNYKNITDFVVMVNN